MSGLENLGYQKYPYDNILYLNIQWNSFEEYLGSLRARTKQNIRREIKKCAESGIKIEVLPDFWELAKTLAELGGKNVLKWTKGKWHSPYDVDFYKNLSKFASDKVRLFVASKNGDVVGFCCCFQQGDNLYLQHCGFNYEVLGKTDFTYFNAVYYAPIRWAIENKIRRMNYARGLAKLKKRRGLMSEKVYSFVKCQNRAISVYHDFAKSQIHTRFIDKCFARSFDSSYNQKTFIEIMGKTSI
jgi:predicted N-acyltransferase